VVSQAEAVVGGGALLIDCTIAATDPALKEVSNGVEWRICWLWEKSGGVLIVRIWVIGGSTLRLDTGGWVCGLGTVLAICCVPKVCSQWLWSILVCSHMPGSSILAITEWGWFPSLYNHTTLHRIRNMSIALHQIRSPYPNSPTCSLVAWRRLSFCCMFSPY